MKRVSAGPPFQAEITSLRWLRTQEEGLVLSGHEYGYMIEAVSFQPAYLDKDYYLQSKDKLKINLTQEIFMSRDYDRISEFLSKNNITYIWINSEMKHGSPWKKDDDGMLLIIRNSRPFTLVYSYLGVDIWKFS